MGYLGYVRKNEEGDYLLWSAGFGDMPLAHMANSFKHSEEYMNMPEETQEQIDAKHAKIVKVRNRGHK